MMMKLMNLTMMHAEADERSSRSLFLRAAAGETKTKNTNVHHFVVGYFYAFQTFWGHIIVTGDADVYYSYLTAEITL